MQAGVVSHYTGEEEGKPMREVGGVMHGQMPPFLTGVHAVVCSTAFWAAL